MESISIFDIFKIGVGPSSSHTLGPWQAAREFATELLGKDFDQVQVHLYGSLSKTGRGHATDLAVQLGLEGHDPATFDTNRIQSHLAEIKERSRLQVAGRELTFHPARHIHFEPTDHELHPNTLVFVARLGEALVLRRTFASVGGGFVERAAELDSPRHLEEQLIQLPYPIQTADDLIVHVEFTGMDIVEVISANEQHFRPAEVTQKRLADIIDVMLDCVYRGCTTEGILPGGLRVKRRAKQLCTRLCGRDQFADRDDWMAAIRATPADFPRINQWVSCFALAVNEENAALGRVVTSPTNGAAGVIPAVMLYNFFWGEDQTLAALHHFLLVAGEIGCLFKKGATISAAVGGCQAEIGVSSAMAAAGLTQVYGGSAGQILTAAEIAMEHHLGLTCDPIGGLVQIPCIERNAMGANKAITASNLALAGDPDDTIVKLDTVIKTMWQTALDMNHKYKETSEGGLAFHIPVIQPEC